MKDLRNSPEYNQWKNEVKHRDGNACRRCGFENNLHVHHIKPFKKYPEFAVELDNGLTLCGNCHSLLRGKEESTDLQTFLCDDANIGEQLKAIDGGFSNYLPRKLQSKTQRTRDNAALALFSHLKVYPNSLDEMLPHLIYLVDSENWADESNTKRQAIRWLERMQTSTVTPKQQAIHDEYLELTIANEIAILEARPFLFNFETEMLKALKDPETAAEQELRNDHGEFLIANEIAALEARQDLDAFQTEVLEALKAVQVKAIQVTSRQTISRYEQRVEQQRVEQRRIAEQERLRQENEKRETEEKRQQEIISKYGSLEAYRRHQNIESFVESFLPLCFFLGVPILLVFLSRSC
ncbi:hypothetical protein F4Z99_14940 [Candidatus Poribacteria bacterium]|nr:hypothetical protein [Candidatus Poribacteria bacterium]